MISLKQFPSTASSSPYLSLFPRHVELARWRCGNPSHMCAASTARPCFYRLLHSHLFFAMVLHSHLQHRRGSPLSSEEMHGPPDLAFIVSCTTTCSTAADRLSPARRCMDVSAFGSSSPREPPLRGWGWSAIAMASAGAAPPLPLAAHADTSSPAAIAGEEYRGHVLLRLELLLVVANG